MADDTSKMFCSCEDQFHIPVADGITIIRDGTSFAPLQIPVADGITIIGNSNG